MDNYYTRNVLAQCIESFSKGRVKVIGTVRPNMIGSQNKIIVQNTFKDLNTVGSCEKGNWAVTPVYSKTKTGIKKVKQYIFY